jgi:putative nucleotidyltransferase with HDIG domain
MDEGPATGYSPLRRLGEAWHATRLWLVFAVGLIGISAAMSLPLSQRQSTFGLEPGDVAPQDILAPYPISYTSEGLTQEARQAAADAVAKVYDPPDSSVARAQLDKLRGALDFIESVRADANATTEQKISDLAALQEIDLSQETAQALLDLSDSRWEAVRTETISVLEQVMRTEIRPDRVDEARRTIPALVSISMPQEQAGLVGELARAFVAPNSLLNQEATQAAKERASQAVSPIIESYAAGETIVSRGEIVTQRDIEALSRYGLLTQPNPWREIALRSLLVILLGFTLLLYGYRAHPDQIQEIRLASTVTILFLTFTIGMQVMIPSRAVLPYLFPAATLPMLMAILFSPGMGLMSAVVTGALAGFLAPRGLEVTLYVSLSGVLGALMIGKAERLSSFFWAGLASALAAVLIVVIFRFPDAATDLIGKATLMGTALLSGLLSASLAFGLLMLIGNVLGITTNLQLLELARPDHPLLQFILRNAPGTYQHSLQVANLAEQAARTIDANPLLTRVGALYHDAGKALRPQFFIENQVQGQNIHEQLDPTTSASIILGHVKDGLELARKYRLPAAVRSFIPEHHGRLDASYQYQLALDAAGGDESKVDKADFSYPGPRPHSKETALLMLADGVEAKARAESPKDEEEIDGIVRWVIQDRLAAGQLDRTDLTLKDLDTVRRSFVNTLRGMYHPRIRYQEEENGGAGSTDAELQDKTEPTPAPANPAADS